MPRIRSDSQAKGFLPVLTDTERQAAVRGCRFVDEHLDVVAAMKSFPSLEMHYDTTRSHEASFSELWDVVSMS